MKTLFLLLSLLFLRFNLVGTELAYPSTKSKDHTGERKDLASVGSLEVESGIPLDPEKTMYLTSYQFQDDFVVRLTDGKAKFGKNHIMVKNGNYFINEPRLSYVIPMDSLKKFSNNTLLMEFIYQSKTHKLYGTYNSETKYLDLTVKIE